MLPRHLESVETSDGVVHVVNYLTMNDEWLTMCGLGLHPEHSDHVALMKDCDFVDKPASCLECLANQDDWNDDGTRKRGHG